VPLSLYVEKLNYQVRPNMENEIFHEYIKLNIPVTKNMRTYLKRKRGRWIKWIL